MLFRSLRRLSNRGFIDVGWGETGAHRPGRARARGTSRRHLDFTRLEPRLLLCADDDGPFAGSPAIGTVPPMEGPTAGSPTASSTITTPSTATYPLTSVPALSSLLGAKATLYLDFTGDTESQWGSYTNITTPAYDTDGDPT